MLFRTVRREDLLRVLPIEAMAAAGVYGAYQCTEVGRPIEAMAGVARVSEGRVQNAYVVLNVELGLPTPVRQPTDLFCGWRVDATGLVTSSNGPSSSPGWPRIPGIANGCRPSGVAAACVRRAAEDCGWRVTQATVADAANTTPVTVRAHEVALDKALSD